jgi:hypothetical protein
MLTIETTAIITPDGHLTIEVPTDMPPGERRVVVVIEEPPVGNKERPPFDFPVTSYGSWPDDLSLRREDMYGDWGR